MTGEALDGLGPYSLFNALGSLGPRDAVSVGLGVVLRVEHHLPHVPLDPVDYERTFKDHYVGAAPLSDQVACLLSLALGARFRSGGETRSFDIGAPDVRGRPILATHQAPTMTPPFRGSVLPDVAGRTVLLGEAVTVLAALPRLSADDATQVLRASRLYRQALWIADEDPELSWLLLVSAAEVGATHWAAHNGEPAARLEDAMPALADLLRERGGPDLVVATAGHLTHLIRATVRFLHFVTTFGGEAPPGRPEYKWTQVDWARLKKAVGRRPGVRVPVGRPARRRTDAKSAAESALAGGHGARVGAPARHGHGTRQHHVGREGPPDALARVRRDHAMCPHCLVGSAGRRAAAAVSADLYAGPVIFSERPGRQAAERQARDPHHQRRYRRHQPTDQGRRPDRVGFRNLDNQRRRVRFLCTRQSRRTTSAEAAIPPQL